MRFIVVFGIFAIALCTVSAAPRASSRAMDERCPPNQDEESVPVFLPHESDCAKYYECSHGDAIELVCPGILLYNHKLQVCDWPKNVVCETPETTTHGWTTTDAPEITDV